jgi:adenylate kinase
MRDRRSRTALILLGLPGSGKGTQARRLSDALGIPALSTGEMLRREVNAGSQLGEIVRGFLERGALVDDELVNKAVCSRVRQRDCARGFVLDGYPRTVAQAEFLDNCLAKLGMEQPSALWLDIPTAVIQARLLNRLECPLCGRTFQGDQSPLAICEHDGTPLIQRSDDNTTAIEERLRQYELNTAPLLDYYEDSRLFRIPATGSPEQVAEYMFSVVTEHFVVRGKAGVRSAFIHTAHAVSAL